MEPELGFFELGFLLGMTQDAIRDRNVALRKAQSQYAKTCITEELAKFEAMAKKLEVLMVRKGPP